MWWMCGGGYSIACQNSMDHDHETLKVTGYVCMIIKGTN